MHLSEGNVTRWKVNEIAPRAALAQQHDSAAHKAFAHAVAHRRAESRQLGSAAPRFEAANPETQN
jgi:hypothetical protein